MGNTPMLRKCKSASLAWEKWAGIWGRTEGYCMMIGGRDEDVARVKPIVDTLAPPSAWEHMGDHGAGHFVKMIHNGIEYGLMESYGEGFEILRKSNFDLDLHKVA